MNKYGYFDDKKREFIITNPNTPAPWYNYLCGKNVRALISGGAGAVAWYKDPTAGRLTRYRFNGLPFDSPGFYLYIKDGKTIWNPSFFPSMTKLDRFECHHGVGYSRYLAEKNGVQVEVTYFIPLKDDVLLWDVKIKNLTKRKKDLKIYTYMEYSLHDVERDLKYFYTSGSVMQIYFDRTVNGMITNALHGKVMGKTCFSSTQKVTGFDADRNLFVGNGRTEGNALGLTKGLGNTEVKGAGRYACAVLENSIHLKAGARKGIVHRYAVAESLARAKRIGAKYTIPVCRKALRGLSIHWERHLSTLNVQTPDKTVNRLLNTWFPYNAKFCYDNARSISAKHAGAVGTLRFRDSMQDTLAHLHFFPEEARERIKIIMETMMSSGATLRGINTLTRVAEPVGHIRIDAATWGIMTCYEYLAMTGDSGLLKETVCYHDKGKGTILDHMIRGMRFIGDNTGKHGLPQLFSVDWNDGIRVITGRQSETEGETVMVAEQFIYAARLLVEILEKHGKAKDIKYFKTKIRDFTKALNSDALWDGKWFKRLMFKNCTIGTSKNVEGKIFMNAQSWAAMAQTLDPNKVKTAMDSVHKKLNTKYGLRLFAPPFTSRGNPKVPIFPGAGENGGIFLHANTWAIIGEAMLGNSKRAWKYFNQILPENLSNKNPDLYAYEPYAFASWIFGPDNPLYGQAVYSWTTGGASWIYIAGLEYILGIQPTLKGIRIQPCAPAEWKEYKVTKKVRGCSYEITVKNPQKLNGGVVELTINGKPVPGNVIPYGRGKRGKAVALLKKC